MGDNMRHLYSILDLPDGVIERVFSFLSAPKDIANFACTSKFVNEVSRKAPIKIIIQGFRHKARQNFLRELQSLSHESFEGCKSRLQRELKGFSQTFPGTEGLELLDCPVDVHILHDTLDSLQNLKALHISACQQVSSKTVSRICEQQSVRKTMKALSLQRCFSLTWTVLKDLIYSNHFHCIAVSHLDLRNEYCMKSFEEHNISTIQYLALHNCKLTKSILLHILSKTPELRMLSLGGSMVSCEVEGHVETPEVRLPKLQQVEATFLSMDILDVFDLSSVQVLNLCNPEDVLKAYLLLRQEEDNMSEDHLEYTRMILSGAMSCSSFIRRQPLHFAAEAGDTVTAGRLLDMGSNVNARDHAGNTPLFIASERGHADVVGLLVENGAEIGVQNQMGESPLYISSLIGHHAVVEFVVQKCKEQALKWEDPLLYGDGWTPLMAAVVGGHTKLAEKLLMLADTNMGKLVNARNRYGQSVLHIAARKDYLSLLNVFLSCGADPRMRDGNNDYPHRIAKLHGHKASFRTLLRAAKKPVCVN